MLRGLRGGGHLGGGRDPGGGLAHSLADEKRVTTERDRSRVSRGLISFRVERGGDLWNFLAQFEIDPLAPEVEPTERQEIPQERTGLRDPAP